MKFLLLLVVAGFSLREAATLLDPNGATELVSLEDSSKIGEQTNFGRSVTASNAIVVAVRGLCSQERRIAFSHLHLYAVPRGRIRRHRTSEGRASQRPF